MYAAPYLNKRRKKTYQKPKSLIWWSTSKKVHPSSSRKYEDVGIYSGTIGWSINEKKSAERSYLSPEGMCTS